MGQAVPSERLYKLSCFFLPWVVLGFEVAGLQIYLSFLFCLADVRFWRTIFLSYRDKGGLLYANCLVLAGWLFAFQGTSPALFLLKLTAIAVFCFYLCRGARAYGLHAAFQGVVSACVFSVLQLAEANFCRTGYLSIKSLEVPLFPGVQFGINMSLGRSYARSDFVHAIQRISGSAPEPGFFALILFASVPLFMKYAGRGSWALLVLAAIGSFSKNTPFLGVAALVIPLMTRYLKATVLSFVVLSSAAFFWGADLALNQSMSKLHALLAKNASVYLRLAGAYSFERLPSEQRWFGTGYLNTCRYLDLPFLGVSEGVGFFEPTTQTVPCSFLTLSGLGSLLNERGIIGTLILVFLLLLALPSYDSGKSFSGPKRWLRFVVSLGRGESLAQFHLIWFFVSFLTLHYLTFYPPLFIPLILAYGTGNRERSF